MLVNCPVERSPPLHVYAPGDGAALAILVVPTNPQATAAHDTNTAAPNRVRNFTFSAFRRLCRPPEPVTHTVRFLHTVASWRRQLAASDCAFQSASYSGNARYIARALEVEA